MTTPENDITAAMDRQEAALRVAADEALERASRKPTQENRKLHRAAEAAVLQFIKERHEPETETSFKGLPEALAFLKNDSWKIEKTKFYDDFNDHKIQVEKNGSFRLSAILDYARVNLRKNDGTKGGDAVSLQEQKRNEEMLRIRIDRRQRELKYKESSGELIQKSDVEGELAKRGIYLKTDLKNIFRSGAVEIIKLVGGDPQKAPSLIAYGCSMVDEAMHRYTRPIQGFEED